MLTEKAIRQIAALMHRLHGGDAERFVAGVIARLEVSQVRADTTAVWRQVLTVLEQTTFRAGSGCLRSPPRRVRLDGRFPD